MVSKGYFVITDITGYTAYLTQSGLEEAQSALNFLFEGLLEAIQPPLQVSNFQGDAILSYIPEGSFIQGQTLLEMLENIYVAFVALLEQMHRNSCCDCDACENLPALDLKLFVHYGAYVLQTLRGRQELSGPDVILAHRMMKNEVKEKTSVKSYALFTEAAIEAMRLGNATEAMLPYSTSYDHLGEVKMHVHNLRAVYEQGRDARRLFVQPEEARLTVELDLPAPPPLVWDYLTRQENTQIWLQLDSIDRSDTLDGRVHRGTHFHCHRSNGDIDYTVVDWHPFDYFTIDGVEADQTRYLATYRLTPTAQGSHLGWYWQPHPDSNIAQTEPPQQTVYQENFERLRTLLEADLSAGKIGITDQTQPSALAS